MKTKKQFSEHVPTKETQWPKGFFAKPIDRRDYVSSKSAEGVELIVEILGAKVVGKKSRGGTE